MFINSSKPIVLAGLFSCFIAVLVGAFGAHLLMPTLLENGRVSTFETASRYHFYHSAALLVLGFSKKNSVLSKTTQWVFLFLLMGIVVFSGSLYLLSITSIAMYGAITPIGGLLFLIAWLLWALDEFKGL